MSRLRRWLQFQAHFCIVAAPPHLLRENALGVRSGCNGLAVGDTGRPNSGIHLELAEQSLLQDLQVELSHSGNEELPRLLVRAPAEGGIFPGKLRKGLQELLTVDN